LLAAIVAIACAACSYTKGSDLPTIPSETSTTIIGGDNRLTARDAAVLVGPWEGQEIANVGESGSVTAVFAQDGSVALTWKSATTTATGSGTATGSLSALTISTNSTRCGYSAQGFYTEGVPNAQGVRVDVISGMYQGQGPGVCPTKRGDFMLRRTVTIEHPKVCPVVFSYSGANPFELPNSGDATERAYVQANVSSYLNGPVKVNEPGGTAWTSTGNYAVVLVKAATQYYLYTNVVAGQVVQSQSFNKQGVRQAISHVSLFSCVEPS